MSRCRDVQRQITYPIQYNGIRDPGIASRVWPASSYIGAFDWAGRRDLTRDGKRDRLGGVPDDGNNGAKYAVGNSVAAGLGRGRSSGTNRRSDLRGTQRDVSAIGRLVR